jgi:hypothetical protein
MEFRARRARASDRLQGQDLGGVEMLHSCWNGSHDALHGPVLSCRR